MMRYWKAATPLCRQMKQQRLCSDNVVRYCLYICLVIGVNPKLILSTKALQENFGNYQINAIKTYHSDLQVSLTPWLQTILLLLPLSAFVCYISVWSCIYKALFHLLVLKAVHSHNDTSTHSFTQVHTNSHTRSNSGSYSRTLWHMVHGVIELLTLWLYLLSMSCLSGDIVENDLTRWFKGFLKPFWMCGNYYILPSHC